MTISLANEYRPSRPDDILGHPRHVKAIKRMAELGAFPGSSLLSGPPGTGKTTTARVIAKLAICSNRQPNGDPCNECSNCKSVDGLGGPNLYYLDGGAKDMTELVREELIPFFRSRPIGGAKHKVLILDEFQRVSGLAKSVLLAPLEELPTQYPWVISLFTTTNPEQIDEALISRCAPMVFRPIPPDEMVKGVLTAEGLEKTPETLAGLAMLAERSNGCMRRLWNYVQQYKLLQEPLTPELASWMTGGVPKSEREKLWGMIERGSIDQALRLWDTWVADGANPALLGEFLTEDACRKASETPDAAHWVETLDMLAKTAALNRPNCWKWAIARLDLKARTAQPVKLATEDLNYLADRIVNKLPKYSPKPIFEEIPVGAPVAATTVDTPEGVKFVEVSLVKHAISDKTTTIARHDPETTNQAIDPKEVVKNAFKDRVPPIPEPGIETERETEREIDLADLARVYSVIFEERIPEAVCA